ncbi:MAG: VWA domain-containing protein [Proteobacteria bacterium]|nr:VWA domain-containing protein [Pseudomonadota bacterium]
MIETVLSFVSCSRTAGLRISSAEVLDCVKQLEYIDLLDEPLFKDVLRANFAKSRREQAKFDHLYQLFFKELRSEASIPHTGSVAAWSDQLLDEIGESLEGDEALPAILDFLNGNPLRYLEQIRNLQTMDSSEVQGINSSFAPLVRRLEIMSQINAVGTAIERFLANNRSNISWENRKAIDINFRDRLNSARRLLREDPEDYSEESSQGSSYEEYMGQLGQKSFFSLTKREIEEMRDVIEQLVRKLKDTAQRRYAKQKRGVLDIKKTLRIASRYQGVPVELVFRNKPKRKGKIVTLCDVSGSVWSAAKFMLNMLYSLQDCFLQVRSFIFVSDLAEVTETFEKYEINKAVDKALKEADINYDASTDYGRTLRQFKKHYLDILNKKTTFIIIGDGRTNYTNPEEDILGEIRDKCRRIIWLNPETHLFWYTGDSRMKTYEAYCNEVRHCQNLNQLLDFIKTLVL